MSAASVAWSRDEFLEACLGRPVLRAKHADGALEAVSFAKREHASWFIETRVPVEDVPTLARLTVAGFRIVDTNVQMDVTVADLRAASALQGATTVREARAADRAAVEEIAGLQLTTSRFHLDPRIGAELGARIKREWTGNFFSGRRGDRMMVLETPSGVTGFLLVLERGDQGVIDLIAIDPEQRGRNACAALVSAWCAAAPALRRLVVGTQIANIRSQRAYAKLGFRMCSAAHVLHLHSQDAS